MSDKKTTKPDHMVMELVYCWLYLQVVHLK